jgi:hypothetical protein
VQDGLEGQRELANYCDNNCWRSLKIYCSNNKIKSTCKDDICGHLSYTLVMEAVEVAASMPSDKMSEGGQAVKVAARIPYKCFYMLYSTYSNALRLFLIFLCCYSLEDGTVNYRSGKWN